MPNAMPKQDRAAPRRKDGRAYDTGLIRPYRPKPADFRSIYISMGWDGIEEHYATNWRVIRRWIEEEGPEQLRADRAAYVETQRVAARRRRSRYALGRTLHQVSP